MGYSCTAAAMNKLEEIVAKQESAPGGPSNGWRFNGADYFYEIGAEQADGSVVGEVWRNFGKTCSLAGKFKINPNGEVKRFPVVAFL